MLLGPIEVAVTGFHALDGALHADRSDIDVSQDHGDHKHGAHAMSDMGQFHQFAPLSENGRDQYQSGDPDRATHENQQPEHGLLTHVEEVRRHMFLANHAATAQQPGQIAFLVDVAAYEAKEDQYQGQQEQGTEQVVSLLAGRRQYRKSLFAYEGYEQRTPEEKKQACEGEKNEDPCDKPVDGSLVGRVSGQLPIRQSTRYGNSAPDQVEDGQGQQHAAENVTGDGNQLVDSEVPPAVSVGVYQHTGIDTPDLRHTAARGGALPDVAPEF